MPVLSGQMVLRPSLVLAGGRGLDLDRGLMPGFTSGCIVGFTAGCDAGFAMGCDAGFAAA